jgi:hypothetical protein
MNLTAEICCPPIRYARMSSIGLPKLAADLVRCRVAVIVAA